MNDSKDNRRQQGHEDAERELDNDSTRDNDEPQHYAMLRTLIDECGLCLLDGETPSVTQGGARRFGWHEVKRAIYDNCPNVTTRTARETLEAAKNSSIVPNEVTAPPRYVAFENGVWDVEARKMVRPEDVPGVVPVTIPHKFDPDAQKCETVEAFLNGVCCDDTAMRGQLEEVMGLCISRYAGDYARLVWLYGDGANGKSTFLAFLETLVGRERCAAKALEDLKGTFAISSMVGSLVNISEETSGDALNKSKAGRVAKKLVTGEPVEVEYKGETAYAARLFVTLLATSNDAPTLPDDDGTCRRVLLIEFRAKFNRDAKEYDPRLREKLAGPDAIAWGLVLAMRGLARVVENYGPSDTERSKSALNAAVGRSSHLFDFLNEDKSAVRLGNEKIALDALYARYGIWCNSAGIKQHDKLTKRDFEGAVCKHLGIRCERVVIPEAKRGIIPAGVLDARGRAKAFMLKE